MSYLQYPGTIATKCVSSVNDVAMLREACEKIAYALQQGIALWINENFSDEILRCVLYETFSYRSMTKNI